MQRGSISALIPKSEDDVPGILIGRNLAEQLGLNVGDTATLLTPQGTLSPMGMIPRTRRVRVVGIYALGLYEFDAAYGFVSLDFAERLLGKAMPDLIEVRVNDITAAPQIAERLVEELGSDYGRHD